MIEEKEHGIETGEVCNRNGCEGIIEEHRSDGSCSCHINPPCGYCEADRHYCPMCDWDAKDEQDAYYEANKPSPELLASYKKQNDAWQKAREDFYEKFRGKELVDKIQGRIESHTHFSQKVYVMYPIGTPWDEVLKYCKGTFGGRIDGHTPATGRLTYIAYTD